MNKIKGEMFKLHRHKSDRLSDKVEFRLSSLQAFKIPRPWDKLVLLIVTVDTGKVIAKSSKATVRSGTCQWTETESIWVSQDDVSKELEESHFKIVVSLGSARSAILGEIVLNLKDYLSSGDSGPLLLPLNNCSYATTLQVRVQCIPPKSKSRVGKSSRETTFQFEDQTSNNDELDSKSDGSDNTLNRSIGSASSNPLGGTSYPDEMGHRDRSLSASGSHHSSDSGDGSLCRTNLSPKGSLNGGAYVGRLDSSGSHVTPTYGRVEEIARSNQSSFSSRASGSPFHSNQWQEVSAQASENGVRPSESSKDLIDDEIEELRDEVKMWERHSRQLKLDIGILKKEISDKSKQQSNLETELSAVYGERNSLKQEVEQLQLAFKESTTSQLYTDTISNKMTNVQKELEDELKFQKESNGTLTLQLRKTQESNIELVSILQELEDTVERQKLEIINLSQNLVSEDEGFMTSQKLSYDEAEWAKKLSFKEQEIVKLEEKLSNMLNTQQSGEVVSNGNHSDLIKEIEVLTIKVQELEKDCAELTDENLDLIFKMKKMSKENDPHGFVSSDFQAHNSTEDFEPEIALLKSRISELEEELQEKEAITDSSSSKLKNLEKLCHDLESDLQYFKDEAGDLEIRLQKTQVELEGKITELSDLKQQLETFTRADNGYLTESKEQVGEQEIDSLKLLKMEMEDLIVNLQKEKSQLEEDLAFSHRESGFTSKRLEDVQRDLKDLTNTLDSQVSANKILEKKSMELESCKSELELQISELEQENVQFSEHISGLEAQLRYLTNDEESNRLELEDSRSIIVSLKDEIEKLKAEMEIQKGYAKQKLQETQKRMSEALEESEVLRRSNSQLQATIESLTEEGSSLRRLTGDLKKQKFEMHERITHLEVELNQSQNNNLDLFKQVEFLEGKLSSLQKDIVIKENSMLSQLESIFQEHKEQEEKIRQAHTMINKLESEKAIEIENLEREIAHLTAQMTSTDDEKEKIASEAVREASNLHADKARLEYSLQEVNAKVKLYETDLQTLRQESKNKIQGLIDSMNASKQSEEMLTADIEHMKRLTEGLKSSEEKSRKLANELELKLKSSDYEKQQIMEEVSDLKVQLQKMSQFQGEILVLKASLDEAKFEKGKLEELLKSLSEECEGLKTERDSLNDKVLSTDKALSSGEDDRRSKVALQEKLLRLESDLSAKEASYAYEAELKNELSRIKRANSEYQRKAQSLEQEKDELMKKAQLMEKELMLKKEPYGNITVIEGSKKLHDEVEEPHGSEVDPESKVHILETQLAEALEANNMYKEQLEEFLVAKQTDQPQVIEKSANDNNASSINADKMVSLEAELKDMKERYLQMSLQYAEVEAQREELVMQLKSVKKEKRWFS